MRASLHGPDDLPGMIAGISGCAVHADLTTIAVGVGAEQAAPMAHPAESPALGFRVSHRILHLLSGMTRSGHRSRLKMPIP
jgi:hypothetical protein